MNALLGWPAHRPRAAIVVAAILTVASLLLVIFRLRAETSLEDMLDKSDPAVAAMGEVLERYPVVNELLVLVTLPNSARDDESKKLTEFALRFQQSVDHDADAVRLITHVRFQAESESRAFVEKVIVPNGLLYLSDSQLPLMLHRLSRVGMNEQLQRDRELLSQPGPAAGALAKMLAKDPLRLSEFLVDRLGSLSIPGAGGSGGGSFFSPDRRSLLIRIDAAHSPSDFSFAKELTATVQRLTDLENRDGMRIDIAGAYAMAAHSARRIQLDSYSDIISTVVGLVILFVLACRRPLRLFWFSFFPVALGLVWGFGAYALIQHTITPLAAIVGGTLGAIGLDYTIHFISHFQEVRAHAASTADAVHQTSRELFFPSLAAWLTSVIGFAAVVISPVRVLRDFAILGTLCLIGAWLATLLVLPPMLTLSRRREAASFAIRFSVAGAIGQWIGRHARALLIVSGSIIALMIIGLCVRGVRYTIETDPMILHPQPSRPLEAQRFIARRMQIAGGAMIVQLHADSDEQLVHLSHQVAARLNANSVRLAGVTSTFGLASLLPDPEIASARREVVDPQSLDRVSNDLRASLAANGFRVDAYAGYLTFLRRLLSPPIVPGVADLAAYPEIAQLLLPRANADRSDRSPQAVTLLFSREPMETREARESALTAVREALHGLNGVVVTGTAVIGHDLETAMYRDLPRFVIIALIGITAYLLIHFRSVKLAAMALLPIAVSLLCVVAFISFFDVRLNLLHTVMAPLLLGINLDYGIFAVHAWNSSRDRNELTSHFPGSFAALIMCGGSTVIGFGSLIVTSIPAVESLGWLINVGVFTCVAATLFVLWPAMLLPKSVKPPMSADERE